jgi:hypothetical protein
MPEVYVNIWEHNSYQTCCWWNWNVNFKHTKLDVLLVNYLGSYPWTHSLCLGEKYQQVLYFILFCNWLKYSGDPWHYIQHTHYIYVKWQLILVKGTWSQRRYMSNIYQTQWMHQVTQIFQKENKTNINSHLWHFLWTMLNISMHFYCVCVCKTVTCKRKAFH